MSTITLIPGETRLVRRNIRTVVTVVNAGLGQLNECIGLRLVVLDVDDVESMVTLTAEDDFRSRNSIKRKDFRLRKELVTEHYFDILSRTLRGVWVHHLHRDYLPRSQKNRWHLCNLLIQLTHESADIRALTFEVEDVEVVEHDGRPQLSISGKETLERAVEEHDKTVRFDGAFLYVANQAIYLALALNYHRPEARLMDSLS